MAKEDPKAATENSAQGTTPAAAAPDERYKMIKDPDTGEMVKRKDFVLKRWSQKKSRGDIAKELTQIVGKKVPYQIVFQYTKGVPGGPDKTPEATPAPAAEAKQAG